MSKAEEFIKEHTRKCPNQSEWSVNTANKTIDYYVPWLTPDEARKAVEIAREEVIEKVCSFISDNIAEYIDVRGYTSDTYVDIDCDKFINDIKQAVKDE